MSNLEKAKNLYEEGKYEFVCITQNGEVLTSNERGIKYILSLTECASDVKGASIADKIVGKAAALVSVYLGIKEIFAEVISESAVKVLEKHGIYYEYKNKVGAIENRTKTGMCPMEQTVFEIDCPKTAVDKLKEKVASLSKQQ